jgi:hypothetical protein
MRWFVGAHSCAPLRKKTLVPLSAVFFCKRVLSVLAGLRSKHGEGLGVRGKKALVPGFLREAIGQINRDERGEDDDNCRDIRNGAVTRAGQLAENPDWQRLL